MMRVALYTKGIKTITAVHKRLISFLGKAVNVVKAIHSSQIIFICILYQRAQIPE